MKHSSKFAGRFALSGIAAAAALCLLAPNASALGLGRLSVQSALGEAMRAEIDVTNLTTEEASSLQIRVAPPDAYRAAGVDYNAALSGARTVLQKRADGRTVLRLTSDRVVQEPFVDVILEITWASGRLVREYTLLFDPPRPQAAPPAMAAAPAAPAVAAAPAPPPAPATAPPSPPAATPAPALSSTAPAAATARATPAPVPTQRAPAPAPLGRDEYTVQRGDTLSRIATQTQRPGVSLDQMLVSLYRGNPSAFIDNNMNLLRSGAVLAVPSADAARQIEPGEARQTIQAQSADFAAYRQRLAAAMPSTKADEPARQATGKVQAAVEDRKQAAAPTPDKLTLSRGSVRPGGQEATISKESEKKEAATRVAELSRNVEELKRLSGASAAAEATPATPATTAPATTAPATKAPSPAPAEPPAPVVTAQAPAPSPAAVPAPAVTAAPPVAAPASPAAPAKPAAQPVPAPMEEPGLIESLLDNPMVLPMAGVLVLLLAGMGVYRLRTKASKDSGETSFLESRLQPDSFFGASGGQRIDTRDASGVSSSMSYSLSQLDAIGDVDPVAEADVYLAYGRDLQAEEILKEAMRGDPDRLAIRTKLLEVYAKRRDTKGFELLATQLYGMSHGEGEEWKKAQELGASIDADNPLYQPGGKPASAVAGLAKAAEALDASTMPQTALAGQHARFLPSQPPPETQPPAGVDVDLDLDVAAAASVATPMPEATQPLPSTQQTPAAEALDFDLPTLPATASAPKQPEPAAVNFDLGDLSLDLDAPPTPAPAAPAAASTSGFGDLDVPEAAAVEAIEGGDPLQRKLELAEEFRQIGDTEGARDLLEEVIAKASGTLKSRAEGMLNSLA